jgi:hypothetical protein
MNRRAITLVEVTFLIGVVVPLGGLALVLAHQVAQTRLPADGRRLEDACLRLRQDALGGVVLTPEAVVAGRHRWQVTGSAWQRDGITVATVAAVTPSRAGDVVHLQVTAPNLPPRTLLLREVRP